MSLFVAKHSVSINSFSRCPTGCPRGCPNSARWAWPHNQKKPGEHLPCHAASLPVYPVWWWWGMGCGAGVLGVRVLGTGTPCTGYWDTPCTGYWVPYWPCFIPYWPCLGPLLALFGPYLAQFGSLYGPVWPCLALFWLY